VLERADYRFNRCQIREFTGWSNTQRKLHLHQLEQFDYLCHWRSNALLRCRNLTNDGYQSYAYDATGQQTYASSTVLTQSYDGDRLRVKKVESGVTTYYLRSSVLGRQVISEINSSGGLQRGYVYLGNQLLALQQNSQVSWVHQDPITKSQRVTNSSGTVTSAIDLDPWGGETARSSNQAFQPHRYTSYERDGNSGDEAMMRRYNGKWHRFMQPDPYDGSYDLANPQSFNRYAYVQNDPANLVDPSGLDPDGPCKDEFGRPVDCGPAVDPEDTFQINTWAPSIIILPLLNGGPLLIDFQSRSPHGPQNSGEPQRPPKEPAKIIEKEKDSYEACVWREWTIFNQNVTRIEEAAQQRFEANQIPWWLEILKNMGPSPTVDERVKDAVPTVVNYATMRKEIEEGTQGAAKARDDAIKKNCKK
jgi:RHS repeat-associated protein